MMTDRADLEARLRPADIENKTAFLETSQFQYLFACYRRLTNLRRHFENLNRLDISEQTQCLIHNICRTILSIFEAPDQPQDFKLVQPSSQDFMTTLDQEYFAIKNSPDAMSDLSIQFLFVIIESLQNEAALCEKFFDSFISGFEEQDSVKQILSNADYTNNELTNLEQVSAV